MKVAGRHLPSGDLSRQVVAACWRQVYLEARPLVAPYRYRALGNGVAQCGGQVVVAVWRVGGQGVIGRRDAITRGALRLFENPLAIGILDHGRHPPVGGGETCGRIQGQDAQVDRLARLV